MSYWAEVALWLMFYMFLFGAGYILGATRRR